MTLKTKSETRSTSVDAQMSHEKGLVGIVLESQQDFLHVSIARAFIVRSIVAILGALAVPALIDHKVASPDRV